MQLDFATVPAGGRYSPKNITAVWVEDSNGTFVKSLEVYASFIRIVNLTEWNAKSAGNKVDAVTGATINPHRAHNVTWDCMDLQHQPVPQGTYKVRLEMTESDSAGFFGPPTNKAEIDFVRGPDPADVTAPDSTGFTGVHLQYR